MKFFRFLTTLIIIQLITHGTQVSTQDIQVPTQDIQVATQDIQVATQDITDFEIRKSSPSIPFHPEAAIAPLDDNGHVLPSNQCKQYIDAFSQSRRCGFSAGLENESFIGEIHAGDPEIQNEIDLSPLTFQHRESVRQLEVAKSGDPPRANPQTLQRQKDVVPRGKTRDIIEPVLHNAPSIGKIINQRVTKYGYFRDEYPGIQIGTEPVFGRALVLFPVLSDPNVTLPGFWNAKILSHRFLTQPIELTVDQWVELECQLCETPAFPLAYNVQLTIEGAKTRIDDEHELANLQQNVVMLNGIACVTKMMGESLIDISNSIAKISTKKVEANFRSSLNPLER